MANSTPPMTGAGMQNRSSSRTLPRRKRPSASTTTAAARVWYISNVICSIIFEFFPLFL